MTLASAIIKRAYRETNLIPISVEPSANESTEGLDLLNSLVLSTIGNEAGDELYELQVGGTYDQSAYASEYIPCNARLVLSLTAAKTLKLNPLPHDGERLAVTDALGNLATFNLTLDPNGRKIESATTLTLNTNGETRQWMYRADTGNWVRLTSLVAGDQLPFPSEFDDYFITMLAMRLNSRHGQSLTQETLAALDRQKSQIRARYRTRAPVQDNGSLGLLHQHQHGYSTPTPAFQHGRPW